MGQVRNENVFPQTILDIGLQINLHKFTKLSKVGLSANVLELIFGNSLAQMSKFVFGVAA